MAAKKPTTRDLNWTRVSYTPRAFCTHETEVDDNDPMRCWFEFPGPNAWIPYESAEITRAAKQHAVDHPGHVVEVVQENVARYVLPAPKGDADAG